MRDELTLRTVGSTDGAGRGLFGVLGLGDPPDGELGPSNLADA